MDYGALISRAFRVVRQNRALWVLGFLAALGGVGGSSGNFNFNLPSNIFDGSSSPSTSPSLPPGTFPELPGSFDGLAESGLIAIALAVCCVFLVLGLVFWAIGLAANGGLIAGTNQVEEEGSTRFGYGWKSGASKLTSFIGMRIVLAIPDVILTVLIIGIVVAALISTGVLTAIGSANSAGGGEEFVGILLAALGGVVCFVIPLVLVSVVLNVLIGGTKMFGDRAIMLNEAGAMDAIRQGWTLFRGNFVSVMVMGLILWVISLIVGFVLLFISGLVLAPSIVLLIAQAANSDGSGMGALAGPIALLIGSIFVAVIIGSVINALVVAFRAALWTLVYRQFTGRGAGNPIGNTPIQPPQPNTFANAPGISELR
jgi:hypothetical protein